MTAEVAQMPHLEIVSRFLELPVVESALSISAVQYSRVKNSNQLFHWILTTAEASLSTATNKAVVPIAAPIAKKLENPIHFVDHTLCLGLDKIEEKVPLVSETPEQILENAYMLAVQTVQQASNLKDISWNKANQILATHYGSAAVKGLDNTAVVVDKLIDKYFPATGDEQSIVIKSAEEDQLLHTLQTVGHLSNKAARRVYANIMRHVNTIKTENIKAYIGSVLQFLQLTRYLHSINEKQQASSSKENATNEEKKEN
ncbi:lipid storage droplets surface-binding protein 2-like [Halictus rubicundus]|uniref:lipid storage droplets surface-binding protein 2-like n=1 Tax=Halictus rubicundus TaxID=77578 RepID=UPI00403523A6